MLRKVTALVLVMLLAVGSAFALEFDYSGIEGIEPYEETVVLSFARSADATVTFDDNNPDGKSYTENRWNRLFKEILNIDVTYAWIAADTDSDNAKWGAAIASGNLPDAALVSDNVYAQLLESGLCADITDIFETELSEYSRSFLSDKVMDCVTYNGRYYGLPMPGPVLIGNAMLFVRTDWLEKVGMEIPKTIDDVVNVARAFKEAKLGGDNTIGLMFADGTGVHDGRLQGFMNGYDAYRKMWVDVDGKLAWSDTLPEMREALLALQALYAEGLINEDFAVINGTIAQEYVSSGRCGIFYCTDYATTMSLQAMKDLDPSAEIAVVGIPGLTEDAQTKIQSQAYKFPKIFINKNCKHPEAIMRMLNLSNVLCSSPDPELLNYYYSGELSWYKFLPFSNRFTVADQLVEEVREVREWVETGNIDETWYADALKRIYNFQDPNCIWWRYYTFGTNTGDYPMGSYTLDADLYTAGRMLPDAYSALPTQTMTILGDVVNDELNTAMLEVIMGADISVYDAAVENWYANGGQQITDEVNEWYCNR